RFSSPRPPCASRFPYTTLFRSDGAAAVPGIPPAGPAGHRGIRPLRLRRRGLVELRRGEGGADVGGAAPRLVRPQPRPLRVGPPVDRKSTRLNSSHVKISYAVFC